MIKLLRVGLLALSLALLAAAHLLLGAGLWLGLDDEALAFLHPLACLVPLFCQLNFQRYFGVAFALIGMGVIGIIIAGGGRFKLPPEADLNAPPGALLFGTRFRRRVFRALLVFAVLATVGFAYATVTPPGSPSPALWLATLALVGASFFARTARPAAPSLLAKEELLLLFGYVAFLLLLAFAFREPILRAAAILIALSAGIWMWRKRPGMREIIRLRARGDGRVRRLYVRPHLLALCLYRG